MSATGQPYTDGPFAGPPLSPSIDPQDLPLTTAWLDFKEIPEPSTKRMTSDQFQRLIEARIKQATQPSPRGSTPDLAESSALAPPSNGVLKDVYLEGTSNGPKLSSEASLKDRVGADDIFAPLADLLDPLVGELAMRIVRSYLDSQPLEMQGELCTIMVRDLMAELSADGAEMCDETTLEATTLRTAMEILIDKDDLVDDVDNPLFRDLMLKLHVYCQTNGIRLLSLPE
ncbi:hypothetical protein Z517_09200 [Fonsecaea pedrosoi CBS 271.37]|uniref:Uncharacterized protein n=1 Tax=Fonsecaea pedrosoi CBS 271.37 TaxID=1442368 RepID=A0A0D2DGE6_9EURO|nr:uncharacterized protein Z517_09200 [Fonsecaea pedrosoi CBS 271.37]KIW76756.1 hypothetical protein Z517_09200 [Fonsecaea pedrosoi CBS 271.37]